MSENTKMAITRKGLWMLLMGLLVMVAGFVLMMGGGVKDPNVFNWSMFDFRRLDAFHLRQGACGPRGHYDRCHHEEEVR